MQLPSLFPTSDLKIFPSKNFLHFFLKKLTLNNFPIFSQKKLFLNETFLYFEKGILRTLAYLDLETYAVPED